MLAADAARRWVYPARACVGVDGAPSGRRTVAARPRLKRDHQRSLAPAPGSFCRAGLQLGARPTKYNYSGNEIF
jgi:hypothetical protein